jgi:hypothetical protein
MHGGVTGKAGDSLPMSISLFHKLLVTRQTAPLASGSVYTWDSAVGLGFGHGVPNQKACLTRCRSFTLFASFLAPHLTN